MGLTDRLPMGVKKGEEEITVPVFLGEDDNQRTQLVQSILILSLVLPLIKERICAYGT